MDKTFDIVIIGGGASGLFCANLLSPAYKIALIEKNDRVGKKILATGNGRCNLTNTDLSSNFYNQNIDKFFEVFNNFNTIDYFKSIGLLTYCDKEGRVYPISNYANSVLDILRLNIQDNVTIFDNTFVTKIQKSNNFIIKTNNNENIMCEYIIYACGGNSCNEIVNLHKKIEPYKKSLVSLETDENVFLNNIRVNNVKATININDKIYTETGEILFKDNAVSGIMVFNLSSHMARVNNYKQTIILDLLPNIDKQHLITILQNRQNQKYFNADNFLIGIFHSALSKNIMKKVNFDTKNIEKIANIIKNYEICTHKPLNNEQVYSGGIILDSLTDKLESKQTPDLFFAGECVDVDGVCGGYNLQWAWTSAYVVANYINSLNH